MPRLTVLLFDICKLIVLSVRNKSTIEEFYVILLLLFFFSRKTGEAEKNMDAFIPVP